jgi:hypothetical protein
MVKKGAFQMQTDTQSTPLENPSIPSLSQEPPLVAFCPPYPKPLPKPAVSRPVDADLAQPSKREVSNELRSVVDRATPHEFRWALRSTEGTRKIAKDREMDYL